MDTIIKNKKNSQERIEKVFLQLIQEKKIHEITVIEICKLAKVNRTTFYTNYLDIYDLVDKIQERMISEYTEIFDGSHGATRENYLKMLVDIKNKQLFYKTYFKLGFDTNYKITHYDKVLAEKMYDNKFIDYHCEFFRAGITAIIKKWLDNDCKETPEEILEIIDTEYKNKL